MKYFLPNRLFTLVKYLISALQKRTILQEDFNKLSAEIKRLFDVPQYQLRYCPQDVCLSGKENGEWIKYSTQEVVDKVNLVSKGLLKLGIQPGDKIGLISNNRPEWNFMDLGILQVGAIDVPIYPTASEADYTYIINDAQIKIMVVSDEELYQKVIRVKGECPSIQHVFTFNQVKDAKHWSEITTLGEDGNQDDVEALKANVREDDLATLIYTSGTTGLPKGVMLSHKNIVSNAISSTARFPVAHGARALSFLPVCHVYERMLLYLYMIKGIQISYAESLETIVDNLKEVKPHVFTAVPRLLEKVFDGIMAKGQELTGIKRALFFWAVNLAHDYKPYGANGAWYNLRLSIARALIFKKWQEALGGEVRLVASGSAALQPRLIRIYHAAKIMVMEGYGLTETSPVVSVNEEDNDGIRIGTVGRLIKGVKVRIAEDGEILVKGPNVMMGYYNQPEKTAEVIDELGWFHTGDIGEMVDGEFLKITDRKKEIFKTSGGKYIAPQVLENKMKESRFIEQVVVIGENRKFPSALIVPNFAFLKSWCEEKGVEFTTNQAAIENEKVKDRIWEEVENLNQAFGQWEKIKRMGLLPQEMSIDGGELTPTLKLRRKVIKEKYATQIEHIYSLQKEEEAEQ